MPTKRSTNEAALGARRRTQKRATARKLYAVDAHGKRHELHDATAVVVRHGDVEVELSFPDDIPLGQDFVGRLSTKRHLLTLGPGHGNGVLVRATRW